MTPPHGKFIAQLESKPVVRTSERLEAFTYLRHLAVGTPPAPNVKLDVNRPCIGRGDYEGPNCTFGVNGARNLPVRCKKIENPIRLPYELGKNDIFITPSPEQYQLP